MKRRDFLTATAALAFLPATPLRAEIIPLNRISAYFNGLRTARSTFTQINPDGSRSTGTLYIRRPGRARFEYDPPEQALVVVGARTVAIFDGKSNAGPNQYPLRRTPLWLILESEVDLARREMVIGHRVEGDATVLVAQDPENPQYGRIELYFSDAPVTLRGWVVVDGSGARTRLVLDGLETGVPLDAGLFDIAAEERRRD